MSTWKTRITPILDSMIKGGVPFSLDVIVSEYRHKHGMYTCPSHHQISNLLRKRARDQGFRISSRQISCYEEDYILRSQPDLPVQLSYNTTARVLTAHRRVQ